MVDFLLGIKVWIKYNLCIQGAFILFRLCGGSSLILELSIWLQEITPNCRGRIVNSASFCKFQDLAEGLVAHKLFHYGFLSVLVFYKPETYSLVLISIFFKLLLFSVVFFSQPMSPNHILEHGFLVFTL
jgi:hypothetical protein